MSPDRSNCPGSGCPWANEAEAQDHFTAVGRTTLSVSTTAMPPPPHACLVVLREINADIINVVEVQDCNSLNFLNEAIGLPGYEVRFVSS